MSYCPAFLLGIIFSLVNVNVGYGQTKTVSGSYTYDGKKYPLTMELTDWKAVFNQNKNTTTSSSSNQTYTGSNYRVPGYLRRLHRSNEKLRVSMQKAADKKKYIDDQLNYGYNLFEQGDYASAMALLKLPEVKEGEYRNDKYPMLSFLVSTKSGMISNAFLMYTVTFCYSDYDAAGKKIPGTLKSYIVDDPGTRIARIIQDKYTNKQQYDVELTFAELLLHKKDNEYYNASFAGQSALQQLEKTVAYFNKKGLAPGNNPAVFLLYEACGDSITSSQLFEAQIAQRATSKTAMYQLCSIVINKAEPGSQLLQKAVGEIQKLYNISSTNDEKVITAVELAKGYFKLGNLTNSVKYGLEVSSLMTEKTADHCSAKLLLAQVEQAQQHYPEAIRLYEFVIMFSPDPDLKQAAFEGKAVCNSVSGNNEAALLAYQDWYKESHDKFTANQCAAFYISTKAYSLAESTLKQALKEDPDFYISLLNYGDLLVATGKPKKAREYFVKAANQNSDMTKEQERIMEEFK